MPQAPSTAEVPVQSDATQAAVRKKRGFAAMKPEMQRRIASQGGKAAHASGNAHEFTVEEARAAGAKRAKNVKQPPP